MIIYAGKTTTGRRVAEYGGNSFGVGGRGVVRLGWPKEAVKVEGEAVTFSFQVKSARERNTPDHAVWGFCCTVSAKVGLFSCSLNSVCMNRNSENRRKC